MVVMATGNEKGTPQIVGVQPQEAGTPGVYGDGEGLWLRVRKGGSTQWSLTWNRAGQRTEIGLGGYGQGTAPVSLSLAREKAENIRQKLARGEDPRGEGSKPVRVITFKDCMDG